MRRADAAGRENVVEFRAHLVDRGDDRRSVIGNDARLAQSHPDFVETLRQKREVCVLGATRQDFVADDQDAGGNGVGCRVGLGHRVLESATGGQSS